MFDVKVDLVGDLGALCSVSSLAHEQKSCSQYDHERDDNSLNVRHFEPHRSVCVGLIKIEWMIEG